MNILHNYVVVYNQYWQFTENKFSKMQPIRYHPPPPLHTLYRIGGVKNDKTRTDEYRNRQILNLLSQHTGSNGTADERCQTD